MLNNPPAINTPPVVINTGRLARLLIKGNFLVVSTIPEYGTKVYPMTPKLFKSGIAEFKYLLQCVAYFNTLTHSNSILTYSKILV